MTPGLAQGTAGGTTGAHAQGQGHEAEDCAQAGHQDRPEPGPTGLHQRVPVFLGSKKEVEVATHYHVEADAAI